jgi:hypothetical protein
LRRRRKKKKMVMAATDTTSAITIPAMPGVFRGGLDAVAALAGGSGGGGVEVGLVDADEDVGEEDVDSGDTDVDEPSGVVYFQNIKND